MPAKRAATAVAATLATVVTVGALGVQSAAAATVPGNANIAYAYYLDKGLTADQAAGLAGNLWYESAGVNPRQVQIGCTGPSCGIGIAQWTENGTRWAAENAYAAKEGEGIYNLDLQLAFVWTEFHGTYSSAFTALKACNTVQCATTDVEDNYEAPKTPSQSYSLRLADAEALLAGPQPRE
jgi:hypothetical protein